MAVSQFKCEEFETPQTRRGAGALEAPQISMGLSVLEMMPPGSLMNKDSSGNIILKLNTTAAEEDNTREVEKDVSFLLVGCGILSAGALAYYLLIRLIPRRLESNEIIGVATSQSPVGSARRGWVNASIVPGCNERKGGMLPTFTCIRLNCFSVFENLNLSVLIMEYLTQHERCAVSICSVCLHRASSDDKFWAEVGTLE